MCVVTDFNISWEIGKLLLVASHDHYFLSANTAVLPISDKRQRWMANYHGNSNSTLQTP